MYVLTQQDLKDGEIKLIELSTIEAVTKYLIARMQSKFASIDRYVIISIVHYDI